METGIISIIMWIQNLCNMELSKHIYLLLFLVCGLSFLVSEIETVDPHLVTETKIEEKADKSNSKSPDDKEFRIAWMAPKKEFHNFSADTSVGALKLGLSQIERDQYLHGRTVRVKWYDTKCDSKAALGAAVDAVKYFDPDLFIGPPCSQGLMGVAQLASHWNLPVFSWVSDLLDSVDEHKYTTLVRLSGSFSSISMAVLQVVGNYYYWETFALIYDKQAPYEALASSLRETVETNEYQNMSIKSAHYVTSETKESDIRSMLMQVRKYARVIVFAVPWHALRMYLLIAHELGMARGDFAFICVHGDLFTWDVMKTNVLSDWGWKRNDTHDAKAREAFESVIHITRLSIPEQYDDLFKNLSRKAAEIEIPNWDLPSSDLFPDAYAPYLYDAVQVWARAVNLTLQIGGNPRDGNLIYKMVPADTLSKLTGQLVFNEAMMDRLQNYQVLDMDEDGTFYKLYHIIFKKDADGEAYMTVDWHSHEKFEAKGRWNTPDGNPPPEIPVCGFDGEKCKKTEEENYNGTIIGASMSATVVIIIAVVVHLTLRRYRHNKQLQGMLWQVKFEEIDFYTHLMTGSIRNSFRHLNRRKPPTRGIRKSHDKGRYDVTMQGKSTDSSPEIKRQQSTDLVDTFGSVATVRGNVCSIKRIQKVGISLTKEVIQELNQLMEIKHQNVCAFVGAFLDPSRAILVWEYCAKGSLSDIIWNRNIKLDQMFMFALSHDVAKGLEYIHKSSVHYHGNLKSTNCVVDSRWTCKLTDFGVPKIREQKRSSVTTEEKQWDKLLWTAPECLREAADIDQQKADIFAMGIIFKEIFTRSGPYTDYPFLVAHEIVDKVKDPTEGAPVFRPLISIQLRQYTEISSLIEDCWHEEPTSRPSATKALKALHKINPQNLSMIDNMIVMLEKYANHLEDLVAERTSELDAEKMKTENLLYRMLPQTVAEELKLGRPIKAEHFDDVTLYFSDIVGFTTICASSTPIEVVNLLNSLYTLFDAIITKYDVYKVETIGDAYMIASGLPKRNGKLHIQEVADCALDILASVSTFCIPHQPEKKVRIRIGIHTGPVVAGVVGLAMPRYCLFGDTVNTASRMESTGLPLRIHLSSKSAEALDMYPGYQLHSRGEIHVKGKGPMKTYFLCGKDGFQKELPKWEENAKEALCSRPSLCSVNSVGSAYSYVSNPTSRTSNTSAPESLDDRYKSKETSILEVTCL